MSRQQRQTAVINERDVHQVWDDFAWYISPHYWTIFNDTNCTATITANGVGGLLALNNVSAVDNDQVGISSTNATFKFAANTAMDFYARVALSEANTDDANWCVGFASDFTTDVLTDNGGGPASSHSAALIYKVDGGTKLKVHSSVSTTQNDTQTNFAANTGAGYVELRIHCEAQGDGNMRVTYFADDQQLKDDTQNLPIAHTITHTSAAAMKIGAMVKDGGSNAEVLNVDYLTANQNRV